MMEVNRSTVGKLKRKARTLRKQVVRFNECLNRAKRREAEDGQSNYTIANISYYEYKLVVAKSTLDGILGILLGDMIRRSEKEYGFGWAEQQGEKTP